MRRIARSFQYAFEGLRTLLGTQPNFSVHVVAAAAAVGLGIVFGMSAMELGLLVVTIAVVLVAESVNTAFETLCDLVSPDFHPLVKHIKDISAAAVLIAAAAAVVVAMLLFIPRLLSLLLAR